MIKLQIYYGNFCWFENWSEHSSVKHLSKIFHSFLEGSYELVIFKEVALSKTFHNRGPAILA